VNVVLAEFELIFLLASNLKVLERQWELLLFICPLSFSVCSFPFKDGNPFWKMMHWVNGKIRRITIRTNVIYIFCELMKVPLFKPNTLTMSGLTLNHNKLEKKFVSGFSHCEMMLFVISSRKE
jgi:hypothetical protein